MPLWLIGDHHGQEIRQAMPDGEFQVGRGSANDLVLPSQTVSRHHATLRVHGNTVTIEDLRSLNGTRLNGRPVEGQAEAGPGDLVEFGSVLLRISENEGSVAPVWSDHDNVSSRSVFLSRDDITDSHRRIAATDPKVWRLLSEAGQLLVLPESPEKTFDRVLELVESAVPAGRVLILVREQPGKDPVQRAARVQGDRAIAPLLLSRTMVHMVLDEGAAILTGDAQSDERFKQAQSIVAQDLRSAMAVPLVHHDEILGALYVDTNDPFASYSEQDLGVLTLLGQMLGAKIANARLLEVAREQERMRKELETAAAIQRRLLPQALPALPSYEVVARQRTCEEVGGDLYDVALLEENRALLCLGDVSGKGIAAALLMADVLATIRALRTVVGAGDEIVRRLDRHLLQSTQDEHYLTLFLAELDLANDTLHYVNAGHPPLFLVHADGTVKELESTGPPVGLLDLPGVSFDRRSVPIPPGAALVAYSDGVSEAERGSEQFGDRRFANVLRDLPGCAACEIADRIEGEVDSWTGDTRLADDLTLLVLRKLPA